MVDIKAVAEFKRIVPLREIKATPGLENMALVKNSRLSVQPVSPEEWDIVVKLGHDRLTAPRAQPLTTHAPKFNSNPNGNTHIQRIITQAKMC